MSLRLSSFSVMIDSQFIWGVFFFLPNAIWDRFQGSCMAVLKFCQINFAVPHVFRGLRGVGYETLRIIYFSDIDEFI